MKKILLITTGGTIAMQQNEHGHVALGALNPLSQPTKTLSTIADVTTKHFSNIPSAHVTPEFMIRLSDYIKGSLNEQAYDGVVITHGTDTLEETAYALDILSEWKVPVIITGAMRSSNEISADGPFNLITAVQTAISEEAVGQGVLVVFNGEIHCAKYVTKTDTSSVCTFKSPATGPIGKITKQQALFYFTNKRERTFNVRQLSKNVVILKTYLGMKGDLLDAVSKTEIDGLILEALGQGNVPPDIVPALKRLIDQDIPVILTSRCQSGNVQPTYNYDGGGKTLQDAGVIFTNGLNGQKARLKLIAALELIHRPKDLSTLFK